MLGTHATYVTLLSKFTLAGVELMVLSGGQVVLAYIIIVVCFALAMAVLCGEVIVERAHKYENNQSINIQS